MTSRDLEQRRRAVIAQEVERGGFRGRVNAKCAECIYDPGAGGTWRQQVQDCTDSACPLYAVRPRAGAGALDNKKPRGDGAESEVTRRPYKVGDEHD